MRYRLLGVPVAGVSLVLTGFLVFGNLNQNLVYYLTPSEAAARRSDFADGRRFRLAGTVAPGSLTGGADAVRFVVTDGSVAIPVAHRGAPPQLFREGIEVVVEGAWAADGFDSDTIIVKHDERYEPPRPAKVTAP